MLQHNVFIFLAIFMETILHSDQFSSVLVNNIIRRHHREMLTNRTTAEAKPTDMPDDINAQIKGYIECYECSDFPAEEDSQDESLGPCPGWKRPAKKYGSGQSRREHKYTTLYDGCMTIVLTNGSVVSQNAVIFKQCLEYSAGSLPSAVYEIFGVPAKIYCCQGSLCNGPTNIRIINSRRTQYDNKKVMYVLRTG